MMFISSFIEIGSLIWYLSLKETDKGSVI